MPKFMMVVQGTGGGGGINGFLEKSYMWKVFCFRVDISLRLRGTDSEWGELKIVEVGR